MRYPAAILFLSCLCAGAQTWYVKVPNSTVGYPALKAYSENWQCDHGETLYSMLTNCLDGENEFPIGYIPPGTNRLIVAAIYADGGTARWETNIIGSGFEFSHTNGVIHFLSTTDMNNWLTNTFTSPFISAFGLAHDAFRLEVGGQATWWPQCSLVNTNQNTNETTLAMPPVPMP
ncbi:MAG: hypothetical protein KGL39_47970 [Patescibacteria group bacterium]|nr:hypothetical protein [Patescibacteria group bacterium]